MKKLLLAINIAAAALLGLAGIYVVPKAIAQCTGVFPPNTVCGNLSATLPTCCVHCNDISLWPRR